MNEEYLIHTKLLYREIQEELQKLNVKPKIKEDDFSFDLRDVGGIMKDDNENYSIILLQGKELLIHYPFIDLIILWKQIKKA